jgi:hypothetical protein
VAGEDVRDQPPAPLGETYHDVPPIVAPPRLIHQAAPDQVADHHGGVAVRAQQLLAEVPLAERSVVQQGLQHAELADGEPHRGHHAAHAGGDGLGGPHQLDVGVERRRFRWGAAIPRRHRSNSNEFLRPAPGVVNRPRGGLR